MGTELLTGEKFIAAVPQMLELEEHMVVNGHVYDKDTMLPSNLNFIALESSVAGYTGACMLQNAQIHYTGAGTSTCSYLTDTVNPAVTWVVPFGNHGSKTWKFTKLEVLKKRSVSTIASLTYGVFSGMATTIHGQTSKHVFMSQIGSTTNPEATLYCFYNKATGALTSGPNNVVAITKPALIYEDANQFVFIEPNVGVSTGANITVASVNKNSAVRTDAGSISLPITGILPSIHYSDAQQSSSGVCYGVYQSPTDSTLGLVSLRYDPITVKVVKAQITVTNNQEVPHTLVAASIWDVYDTTVLKSGGQEYVVATLTTMQSPASATAVTNVSRTAIVVWRLNSDGTATYVQTVSLGYWYNRVLFTSSGKTLALASKDRFTVYAWSPEDTKFIAATDMSGAFFQISADSNGTVYAQEENGSLHVHRAGILSYFNCVFEQEEYTLTSGEPLTSYVDVVVEGLVPSNLRFPVIVSLAGPAEFLDNSKSSPLTLTGRRTRVPILVTQSGLATASVISNL